MKHALHSTGKRILLLVIAALLLTACGKDSDVQRVRALRLSGHPDSARVAAVEVLKQNSARLDLWREYAASALDAARIETGEAGSEPSSQLIEAALVCAAVYQQKNREPGRAWHDLGRLASAEIIGELSRMRTTIQMQTSSTAMLKPLETVADTSEMPPLQAVKARETMTKYRSGARILLRRSMCYRRMLEVLPEMNPGSAEITISQFEEIQSPWFEVLELDAAFVAGVQRTARQGVDQALAQARGDLDEVGYFLPATIFENGVLE